MNITGRPFEKRIDGEIVSGAIDGKGNEVIPFIFDYLTHWDEEFLLAGEGEYANRKFGLVTKDGELLAGRYFDEIESPDRVSGPEFLERDFYPVKDGGELEIPFQGRKFIGRSTRWNCLFGM